MGRRAGGGGGYCGRAKARAADKTAVALTGTVTSVQEGKMEGVLVTAKPDGGTIAVTVVSNDQGRYAFPASRLGPGHYNLKIRAIGYDLIGPKTADVTASGPATADLALGPTKDLVRPAQQRRVDGVHARDGRAKAHLVGLRRVPHPAARGALHP